MAIAERADREPGERPGGERRPRRFPRLVRQQHRIGQHGEPIMEGRTVAATALREGMYRRMLGVADATTAALIVLLALPGLADERVPLSALLLAPAIVLLAKLTGLYERDEVVLKKSTLDEAPRLVQAAALFTLVLWLFHDGTTAVELDASDVMVI
jgi:hypothetical protein